jgi:hypothetical protein
MKKLLVLALLIFTSASYAQNVKITDYKVAVSSAKFLRLNGTYNWSQVGDSVTSNEFTASGLFNNFYSSLPFSYNIDVTGGMSSSYGDTVRYTSSLAGNINKYFSNKQDFFGFAGTRVTFEDDFDRPKVDVNGGVGYGRFINATPLAKALRIEDELKKNGIITSYLPKSTLLKMGQIIEREGEYEDKYKDIYEAKLIEDLQNEIEATGLTKKASMDALGLFRIRQVLFGINQIISPRFYGYDVRAGISYTLLTQGTAFQSPAPDMLFGGRFSYPIDLRQQINARASVLSPLDSSAFKLVTGNFAMDYSYDLSNRINFTLTYLMNVNQVDPSRSVSAANHILNAAFLFYLESKIGLTLNTTFEKPNDDARRMSTSISLQYFLL